MKKIIFLLLISSACFSQVSQVNYFDRYGKDKNGNSVLLEHTKYTTIENPNWAEFDKNLRASVVYQFMIDNAKPNAFTSFRSYLDNGGGQPDTKYLLKLINSLGITYSQVQKDELNAILTKNFFAIQL